MEAAAWKSVFLRGPMYWRIHSLRTTEIGWSTKKLRLWWRDCWRESLPDFVKEWLHI
ncbi:Heat shock protein HtpX [Geobacillus sp. WSUCF1]|nr:Heat shock protein HtpX [Geobacillus sp. WSUCF1]